MACKWFINHQTPEFIRYYIFDKNNNFTSLDEISKQIREYVKYLFDLLVDDAEDIALEVTNNIYYTFLRSNRQDNHTKNKNI